jgi:hypothetical protein
VANPENLREQTEKMKNGLAAVIGAKGGLAKKGVKHINTWVQELVEDEEFTAQIREGYKIVEWKGAPIKAIVQAQIRKAMDGDTLAFNAIVKAGWVPKVEADITSGGEKIEGTISADRLEQLIRARSERTDI